MTRPRYRGDGKGKDKIRTSQLKGRPAPSFISPHPPSLHGRLLQAISPMSITAKRLIQAAGVRTASIPNFFARPRENACARSSMRRVELRRQASVGHTFRFRGSLPRFWPSLVEGRTGGGPVACGHSDNERDDMENVAVVLWWHISPFEKGFLCKQFLMMRRHSD